MGQISFPTDDPFWVMKYIWPWGFCIGIICSGDGKGTKKPSYQWDDGARSCLPFPFRKRATPSTHHWLLCSPCHSCPLPLLFYVVSSESAFSDKMALCSFSVVGFGLDPDLQLDIITELDLVNTTLGVTQVSGLHNTSKAFLFQGKGVSLLCMGSGLGEELGICLGHVPLECYLLGDHLCYFSYVIAVRNVQRCWGCLDIWGVFWGCKGGSSGHGDWTFGLAVIYIPGDFGEGSEVEWICKVLESHWPVMFFPQDIFSTVIHMFTHIY